MHPRFKISRGTSDEYTFNLTAANGEKILSSERYTAHASALKGISAVKESAGVDARYERRKSNDAKVYFVLKAGNNEIIGTSETYNSNAALEGGIAAVKANAPVAAVEG